MSEQIIKLKAQGQALADLSGLQFISNAGRVVELVENMIGCIETLDQEVCRLRDQYQQLHEDLKQWQQRNPSGT